MRIFFLLFFICLYIEILIFPYNDFEIYLFETRDTAESKLFLRPIYLPWKK